MISNVIKMWGSCGLHIGNKLYILFIYNLLQNKTNTIVNGFKVHQIINLDQTDCLINSYFIYPSSRTALIVDMVSVNIFTSDWFIRIASA